MVGYEPPALGAAMAFCADTAPVGAAPQPGGCV